MLNPDAVRFANPQIVAYPFSVVCMQEKRNWVEKPDGSVILSDRTTRRFLKRAEAGEDYYQLLQVGFVILLVTEQVRHQQHKPDAVSASEDCRHPFHDQPLNTTHALLEPAVIAS